MRYDANAVPVPAQVLGLRGGVPDRAALSRPQTAIRPAASSRIRFPRPIVIFKACIDGAHIDLSLSMSISASLPLSLPLCLSSSLSLSLSLSLALSLSESLSLSLTLSLSFSLSLSLSLFGSADGRDPDVRTTATMTSEQRVGPLVATQ